MRKIKTLLTLSLILLLGLPKQTKCQDKKEEGMIIKKGNFITSVGYGLPGALRIYLRREEAGKDLKAIGIGPLMGKVEYALFENFTIGLSSTYAQNDVHWLQDAKDENGNLKPYRHGVIVKEAALGLRLNYYFINKTKWNMYGGLGAGRGYANAETYTEAPKEKVYINHTFPSPWHFEGTIGSKYFLTKNIGVYTELGLGQSWLLYEYYFIPAAIAQFGLSVKF